MEGKSYTRRDRKLKRPSLIALIASSVLTTFLAAPAMAREAAPPAPVPSASGAGLSPTILKQTKTSDIGVLAVQMKVNLSDPAAAHSVGGKSLYLEALISCPRKINIVKKFQVFSEFDLKGPAVDYHPGSGWVSPSANTYMAVATKQACDQAAPAQLRQAKLAEPPKTPAIQVPEKTPAKTPPAPAKPTPSTPSTSVVQIAASPSERQAHGALDAAAHRTAPPASVHPLVSRATVGSKTFYRAQFEGFGSVAEADAFCKRLKSAGGACLVKPADRAKH